MVNIQWIKEFFGFSVFGEKRKHGFGNAFLYGGLALPAMYLFYPTLRTCAISCSFHSGVSTDARGVSKMHDPKNN